MHIKKQDHITGTGVIKAESGLERLLLDLKRNKELYLIALPGILFYIIFHYIPMYGVIISFKDYSSSLGILRSEWVGLKHFQRFFGSIYAGRVIGNTLTLNLYTLLFAFPTPIILALLLNEVRNRHFKRTVQSITYLPHFISVVVLCGMVVDFTSPTGIVTHLLNRFGGNHINLLYEVDLFRRIYITSDLWQGVGWNSIIYLAAISALDMELYEAAAIDGAKKMRQLWHITLPGIAPTIIMLLILNIGRMMSLGADKVILLYNPVIYERADIISSFIYRMGLVENNHSFSAAVGLFNSVINCILIYSANLISRKTGEYSLF